MKQRAIVFTTLLFLCIGCSGTTNPSDGNLRWIDAMIDTFQKAPLGNPPQSIWRYEYKGQTVYYVPAQCCDQFSSLFDGNGNLLCAPDGGISGQGDGRCPDFSNERKNGTLIWSDPRDKGRL